MFAARRHGPRCAPSRSGSPATSKRLIRERLRRHAADRHAGASPQRRGCQLSLRVVGGRERGRALFEYLAARGIIGDWREPDVIRISPTPAVQPLRRRAALRAAPSKPGARTDGRMSQRQHHHRRRRARRRPAGDPAGAPGLVGAGIREAPAIRACGPTKAAARSTWPWPSAACTRCAGRPAGRGDGAGRDDARPHGARRWTAATQLLRYGKDDSRSDLVGASRPAQHQPARCGGSGRRAHPLRPRDWTASTSTRARLLSSTTTTARAERSRLRSR